MSPPAAKPNHEANRLRPGSLRKPGRIWKAVSGSRVQPFSAKSAEPGQGTDLNAALEGVAERAIPPSAVVLLSDGDWNLGVSPDRAATKLRLRETPVFAAPVGSEVPLPDLAITRFDVPAFAVQGKAVRLPYEVRAPCRGTRPCRSVSSWTIPRSLLKRW